MEEEQLKEKAENSENTENKPKSKVVVKEEWKDQKGWFQKGNQYGKLKLGKRHITTLVYEELKKNILDANGKKTDKTYLDMFLKSVLLKITKEGDTQLMKHFWEMIDGKAKQEVDVDANIGEVIKIEQEKLDKLTEILNG